MSDQFQEVLDAPREFLKDGMQFVNRCQKRTKPPFSKPTLSGKTVFALSFFEEYTNSTGKTADQTEFVKVCKAVGTGFIIMGFVGYIVKLCTEDPLFLSSFSRISSLSVD